MAGPRDGQLDTTRRLLIAGGVGGLLFAGLSSRLAHLQLFSGEKFDDLANANSVSRDPTPSKRGLIFDRFGEPLATHRTSWNVYASRENLDDVEGTLRRIAEIVEFPEERIQRVLRNFRREQPFIPVPILSDRTYEEFASLSVEGPLLKGVIAEATQARSYPRGRDFAHVIGYVARPNRTEIDRAISHLNLEDEAQRLEKRRIERVFKHPTMRVGRLGMERMADDWLRGTPGVHLYRKNAEGRVIERLPDDENAPKAGSDIHLTIDAGLQKACIEEFGEETGAGVVIDLKNGDILALASVPTYDPNDFVNGISSADYAVLRDDKRSPLYHKAFDGVYPPGSTFKMVVGSAAMKHGAINPSERIYCTGSYRFGNRTFSCWKKGGHGSVNFHEAMKGSCDTYFYEVSNRLGPQKIADEARAYGLGTAYDIGITGGARGIVPDAAWKREARNEPWYDGETLNYGIGQGYLNTSPIQLAVMTARIAIGDGSQLMPRLIGNGPKFDMSLPEGVLPEKDILDLVKASMYGVTSEPGGTALRAGDIDFQGIRMAGKTGTAQVRYISQAERARGVIKNKDLPRNLRDHGLFVGYAPHDNPRYAVAVVVEHAVNGSGTAYPIANRIMNRAFVRASGRDPAFQYAARDKPSSEA